MKGWTHMWVQLWPQKGKHILVAAYKLLPQRKIHWQYSILLATNLLNLIFQKLGLSKKNCWKVQQSGSKNIYRGKGKKSQSCCCPHIMQQVRTNISCSLFVVNRGSMPEAVYTNYHHLFWRIIHPENIKGGTEHGKRILMFYWPCISVIILVINQLNAQILVS